MTDSQIANELGDKPNRIAAQRQRLAEKFDIRTPEQLATVANELAPHFSWNAVEHGRTLERRGKRWKQARSI
jgi:hypothetical protein